MTELTYENGYANFRAAIIEAAKSLLNEFQTEKGIELQDIIDNMLLDKLKLRHLNRHLSPRDQAFGKIWKGYTEIEESIGVLREIAVYLKHFPPKSARISNTRFLRYHIGNYLNEVYILRKRLETYPKVIIRLYRDDTRLSAMNSQITNLTKLLSAFDKITCIRGEHVHQRRYDDVDLDRLCLLELLFSDDQSSLTRVFYPTAVRHVQQSWSSIITNNNSDTDKLLDIYFGILRQIVFSENGEWISPVK